MISPRTVCFVYFALLFALAHAGTTDNTEFTIVPNTSDEDTSYDATMSSSTIIITASASRHTSTSATAKQPFCTPAPSEKNLCLFSLPNGNLLQLTVVALTVSCLALLLITLMCTCKVCHLRGIISGLQPRQDNIDLRHITERNESTHGNEGQADGQPTETCVMLSEVNTGEEEREEHEDNKNGQMKDATQPSTEPPVKDPNGDVAQENSHKPDTKEAESCDTGV